MKKLVCLLLITGCTKAMAQDSTAKKIKELYGTITNISPVNLRISYKQQIKNKTFFKISLLNLGFNMANNNPSGVNQTYTKNMTYSAGLGLGLEFRSNLYNRFAFYHGPNLSFSSNTSVVKIKSPNMAEQTNVNTSYTAGIPYTLGFLFRVNGNFYMSAELNPGIYYSSQFNTNRYENMGVGLENYGGVLYFAYRF